MGKINVVGTGPGSVQNLTIEALEAIKSSEIIIGYRSYLEHIESLIKGKTIVGSSMMQEIDRCKKCFEYAEQGKTVALISGGDSGIYGMAGLVLEIASVEHSDIEINIVAGLSALSSCAANLGAPLMHDFASISLSDLLTPWKLIEKRLDSAASADFVMVIYNPKSKKRVEHIKKAKDIVCKYRSGMTPVGIVSGSTRDNEDIVITDLDKMLDHEINMQSTVIIGNSTTFIWKDFMITPRGYKNKYSEQL